MRERTMRIGSAGKTFSLTGWKVGYITAAANLTPLVQKAHQNLTFTTAPNLQRAVAVLSSFGYHPDERSATANWYAEHHHHLAPFVAESQLVVELHKHFAGCPLAARLPVSVFWERARRARLDEIEVWMLNPVDSIIHLCVHLVQHRFNRPVRELFDIAEFAASEGPDWSDLLRSADLYDLHRHLIYPLWLARTLAGAQVQEPVLYELGARSGFRNWQDAVLKRAFASALISANRPARTIPPWLLESLCSSLLEENSRRSAGLRILCDGLAALRTSARAQADLPAGIAAIYALMVHPWRLLLRRIRAAGAFGDT